MERILGHDRLQTKAIYSTSPTTSLGLSSKLDGLALFSAPLRSIPKKKQSMMPKSVQRFEFWGRRARLNQHSQPSAGGCPFAIPRPSSAELVRGLGQDR